MSGKEFIGSIAISFIAIGVVSLFALPFLYPAMQTNIEDIQTGLNNTESDIAGLQSDITDLQSDQSDIESDIIDLGSNITDLQSEDKGIVLQSKYIITSSLAQITDSQTSAYIPVPDTELNITIKSNSRIVAIFSAAYILGVSNSLDSDRVGFYISLAVEGKGNRTLRLSYYESNTYPDMREFSSTLYLTFITDPLPEGEYKISVSWISMGDQPGTSYLLFSTSLFNSTRMLWGQEYKT